MAEGVVLKSAVAVSTFDHIRKTHGEDAWQACLAKLSDADRIAITAGGNVPLAALGRFNQAFVDVVCLGSRRRAQDEFRQIGSASAEKLLTGGGIFSTFARFVSPKQVLSHADMVLKSAYPGVAVTTELDADEAGGTIRISDMTGYAYGSQRVVGWLLRGLEIVGGRNAHVTERNWDAGLVDSAEYVVDLHWEGWK